MKLYRNLHVTLKFLVCISLSPSFALSLHEAQEILFKNNPDLGNLQLEIEKSEAQLQESKASLFPSLDALANYSYTTEVSHLSFSLPAGPTGNIPIDKELGDHDKVEFGIDASYPLFTGFTRSQNLKSKHQAIYAKEAELRAGKNQISLKLAGMYYSWQLAELQTEYQQKILEYSLAMQKQLEDFVKAGTGVRSRALTAAAKAKAVEVDLLSAQNTGDSLKYELADFLGSRDSSITNSKNALSLDSTPIPIPDWEKENSESNSDSLRPEIEALERTSEQLRFSEKALSGQRLPQLYALAGYRYANPGLNQTEDAFMNYGIVGLQLKWNLFDGWKNHSQKNQLEVQLKEINEQKRKLNGAWWKSKHLAEVQFERWEKQFQAAKASREAAEASANDLKRQFDVGLATGLDWLEARNQAARATLTMSQARTMQTLAILQWRYAAGKELRF